jgi:hypothetical protein
MVSPKVGLRIWIRQSRSYQTRLSVRSGFGVLFLALVRNKLKMFVTYGTSYTVPVCTVTYDTVYLGGSFLQCSAVKNNVNVPVPSNCKKKKNLDRKNIFLFASWRTRRAWSGSGSVSQRYGSEDPDPYQYINVTDPEHWFLVTEQGLGIKFLQFSCTIILISLRPDKYRY